MTPPVTVAVEDANGNVETGDNATQVGLAIGTNPAAGTLTGGSAVNVSAGVATFSTLSIDKAGVGYTLLASSTPSHTQATSSAFTISPSAPTHLAFMQQPTNAQAGSSISPAVTVAIEDANGNVETGDNATKISLVIGTNPGSGTLSGGSAVTVVCGHRYVPERVDRSHRFRLHPGRIEHAKLHRHHLGRVHDLAGPGEPSRVRAWTEQHSVGILYLACSYRGNRRRERKHRDRRYHHEN